MRHEEPGSEEDVVRYRDEHEAVRVLRGRVVDGDPRFVHVQRRSDRVISIPIGRVLEVVRPRSAA